MITAISGVIASGISSIPPFDPDAQAFFNAETAAGVTLTTTQKNAVNQWVLDAKAANIWTKFQAIYPMVGGTATSHKFNLKNPLDTNAAFRLTFTGGWTHSANGALPNGTNAYANTFLNPNSLASTTRHLSYYSRTNSSGGGFDIGALTTVTSSYTGLILASGGTRGFPNTINANAPTTTSANSLGLYTVSRTANNSWKVFKNNSAIITSITGAATPAGFPLYLAALPTYNSLGLSSIGSYSNKECAFATIGNSLTDADVLALYNATQTFNTTLGRQV